MTAPEAEDATMGDDMSTVSASEVPGMETARHPPGTINPSEEEVRINAGNLDWMKAHVSILFTFQQIMCQSSHCNEYNTFSIILPQLG